MSNKELLKLREFSDLHMEFQFAKDRDLSEFAFLDTARGGNPLVQKQPFNLQEKWLFLGSS